VKPDALLGMSYQLMLQYSPVHFIYAHDRPHAARLVSELLVLADKNIPLLSAECALTGDE
jgi:hypothetical protein